MGETPLPYTKLMACRRQQLVDLARAFDIPIPNGATKDQILPTMITAEQQGIFRTPPKNPYYFHKAHRTSDMPAVPQPENPELAVATAVPPVVDPPLQKPPILSRAKRPENDYRRKQRLLKEAGVQGAFGITKQAMDELAAEHGIS